MQSRQHERERLRLGLLALQVAEGFNTRLAELTRVSGISALRLKAKRCTIVAIACMGVSVRVAFQIKPARRHREIRAQTQLLAIKVGEDVGAPPQALADDIEKNRRRLDRRRRNGLVPRRDEHGEQYSGLGLKGLKIAWRLFAHGSHSAFAHRPPAMGSLHNLPASGGLKLDLLKQVKRPGKTECAAKM